MKHLSLFLLLSLSMPMLGQTNDVTPENRAITEVGPSMETAYGQDVINVIDQTGNNAPAEEVVLEAKIVEHPLIVTAKKVLADFTAIHAEGITERNLGQVNAMFEASIASYIDLSVFAKDELGKECTEMAKVFRSNQLFKKDAKFTAISSLLDTITNAAVMHEIAGDRPGRLFGYTLNQIQAREARIVNYLDLCRDFLNITFATYATSVKIEDLTKLKKAVTHFYETHTIATSNEKTLLRVLTKSIDELCKQEDEKNKLHQAINDVTKNAKAVEGSASEALSLGSLISDAAAYGAQTAAVALVNTIGLPNVTAMTSSRVRVVKRAVEKAEVTETVQEIEAPVIQQPITEQVLAPELIPAQVVAQPVEAGIGAHGILPEVRIMADADFDPSLDGLSRRTKELLQSAMIVSARAVAAGLIIR